MNNSKGFTMTELLAALVIIGVLFGVVMYLLNGTFASTMTQYNSISDNEIFEAARGYALERDAFNDDEYACITVQELIEYGYVKNITEDPRIVKIIRNSTTKAIEEIKYVDEC